MIEFFRVRVRNPGAIAEKESSAFVQTAWNNPPDNGVNNNFFFGI